MNVMTLEGWTSLKGLIDQALAMTPSRALIITSGKPGSFAGGMDLNRSSPR